MTFVKNDQLKIHCDNILKLDHLIRFVGIANRMGTLLTASYREGLKPLMNPEETKIYALQAVLRAEIRLDFQKNIGSLIYSVGKYEKIIRATMAVNITPEKKCYLLVSFDAGANATFIIENKIMRYLDINSSSFDVT